MAMRALDYGQMRERHVELLQYRGQLRPLLQVTGTKGYQGNGSAEFDDIERELKQLSRRIWALRREHKKRRRPRNW